VRNGTQVAMLTMPSTRQGGDWGIGGNCLTAADVHALQGKASAAVPG